MTATHHPDDLARWSRLTGKQRACLDLLVERKTSKEIARILGISKPTVDQRITSARIILGAANRDEAALVYGRLRESYDRIICDPVQVPSPPALMPSDFPDGDPSPVLRLSDNMAPGLRAGTGPGEILPPFRDLWRHDHNIWARLVIMVGILAALMIVVLLGLAIAEALTRLTSV